MVAGDILKLRRNKKNRMRIDEVQNESINSVNYDDVASYLIDNNFPKEKNNQKSGRNRKDKTAKPAANEIFEDYDSPENTKDSNGNVASGDLRKNFQTFRIKKRKDMTFKPAVAGEEGPKGVISFNDKAYNTLYNIKESEEMRKKNFGAF